MTTTHYIIIAAMILALAAVLGRITAGRDFRRDRELRQCACCARWLRVKSFNCNGTICRACVARGWTKGTGRNERI